MTGSVIFCLYPVSDNALLLFPSSSAHEYKWHASASRSVLHANRCVALKGMAGGFCIRASLRCCDTWSTHQLGLQWWLWRGVQAPGVRRLFCYGLESSRSRHFSQLISGTRIFSQLCSTLEVPNTWNILLKESVNREGEMKGKSFS